jgi:GTP cyclohydrolase I
MSTEFSENDWRRFLISLGEDPNRSGLRETPARVEKAWKHWTSGYTQNPAELLKTFEDGAEQYNELIVVRNIPVYSHCEHHLAPFFGKATIGYMPDGKIVGLSKLTRLMECFAKRLQVQERLTIQVANALMESLQPKAVGVVIRCRHLCMVASD